jgi:hypothetical protein
MAKLTECGNSRLRSASGNNRNTAAASTLNTPPSKQNNNIQVSRDIQAGHIGETRKYTG